jgi:hypothetical protein
MTSSTGVRQQSRAWEITLTFVGLLSVVAGGTLGMTLYSNSVGLASRPAEYAVVAMPAAAIGMGIWAWFGRHGRAYASITAVALGVSAIVVSLLLFGLGLVIHP